MHDGTEFYVTTNMGYHTAVWHTDNVEFMVTGEVTKNEMLRIVDEIK